jgi:hypothetical protein
MFPNLFLLAAILKEQNSSEDSKIGLKVHKNEIFLASILKFVIFLCQLCQNIKILGKHFLLDHYGGGAMIIQSTVVFRLRRMKKLFKTGQFFYFFLFWLIKDFPKSDSLTVSWILGQNFKIYSP